MSNPSRQRAGALRTHPLIAYFSAVAAALGVANAIANAAFKLGLVGSLSVSLGILGGAMILSVVVAVQLDGQKRHLTDTNRILESDNAALLQDNASLRATAAAVTPLPSGVHTAPLNQIGVITSFHECPYIEKREITYWIEPDGQDRVEIVYRTAPSGYETARSSEAGATQERDVATGQLPGNSVEAMRSVHWHRIRLNSAGDVPHASSFGEVDFRVISDDPSTEVVFFPTLEIRNHLEGVVFFKPPLSRELVWRAKYRWRGLWDDLRGDEHRGQGAVRGPEKMDCLVSQVVIDFVLPAEAREPFLAVEPTAPRPTVTTRDGRPAVRWIVDNPAQRYPYTLTARLP